MRDAQTKVKRAFTDLVLNENKPLSSMSDLQKIKKKLMYLDNKTIIENGMTYNTMFSSLNDCFTFLRKEIETLEVDILEKENITTVERMHHIFIGQLVGLVGHTTGVDTKQWPSHIINS